METVVTGTADRWINTDSFGRPISMEIPVSATPFPPVSVVIPAFNCESDIESAIASALAQNRVTTEIIIIDDGSTDGTPNVLCELERRHPNTIRVLSQTSQGPASARNAGIKAARHEWIAFLDHDDTWHPDKLFLQLTAAVETGAELVFAAAQVVDSTGRVGQRRGIPGVHVKGRIYEALLFENFITLSSTLVRRSVLLSENGFDRQWNGVEDWALWLNLAARGIEFAGIKEPLVKFRWHGLSLSRSRESTQLQRKQLIAQSLATPAGRRVPFIRRRQIQAQERACSAWLTAEESRPRAFALYTHSLIAWPLDLSTWKGLVKCLVGRA